MNVEPGEPTRTDHAAPTYRVVVIELADLLPRLESGLPNLLVVPTVGSAEERLERLDNPTGKQHWAAGHGRCVRHDLSIRRTYDTHRRAKKAADRLVERLLRQGYVVNRRNDQRRVYVIELTQDHLARPATGYYYVGETSLRPEARLEQHRTNAVSKHGRPLGARRIQPYIVGLRPDLAPAEFFLTKEESEAAEAATVLALRALGHRVLGGHTARDADPDETEDETADESTDDGAR